MRRWLRSKVFQSALLGMFLALSVGIVSAQEFRAKLSGQVLDASGAAVSAATVKATDLATHVAYTARTNQTGSYMIPYILPGTYSVEVTANGFRRVQQNDVILSASQSLNLNFTLAVGAVSQSVEVTSTAPLLNTTTGSTGTVLTEREIANLPLDGRQIYMLLGTTPGTQFTQEQFGASGFSGTRGWDVNNEYSIGGAVQGYNMFTLNGVNMTVMTGFGGQGSWMVAPNVDALQEVNVMTNTYDARYGHTGGGTVSMVMKSGSNAFHGDVYEYLENGALDANRFDNNYSGLKRPNTIQHQYGGTFGGPIRRDKAFFFGSFEGYWEDIPFTTVTSVPPAYLRPQAGQGVDFTQSGYTIYDPTTTFCTVAGGSVGNCPGNAYGRTPFANDTIPANRIDPTGAALVNLFPLPNINVNSLRNNYITSSPDTYRYYQPMVRIDWNTSENTRWYTLFEDQWGHEFRNVSGFPPPAQNGNINTMRKNIVFSQDMTHVFSPSFIGDFKLNFSRFRDSFPDGPLNTPAPSSIGLNMPTVPTTTLKLLPEIYFSEQYPQLVGNSVSNDVEQNLIADADFSKTSGNHTFEFGGEYGWYYFSNPASVGHPNGDFTFGTGYTQYNPTQRGALGNTDGNVIADLLLGYPDNGGLDWNDTLAESFPIATVYGQDNLHATHRLSINLGLRYDVEGGVVDRYNRLNRGMCITCVSPITQNASYQANVSNANNVAAWQAAGIDPASLQTVRGGIQFPGVNGQPRNAYNVDWGNLAPRAGFAYQLDDKTVLSGGWGWMFSYGIEAGTQSGFSITTPYTASLNGGLTPTDYFATGNPFPNGVQKPIGASQGLLTNVGNIQALDFPGRKIPRATVVSLGIQRELPAHMVLSVGYSGNHARALRTEGAFVWVNGTLPLTMYRQLQQSDYCNGQPFTGQSGCNSNVAAALNTSVPNPYYGVVPANTFMGGSPTVSAVNLMVPLSQFGLVGDYTDPYGKSQYDALEVKLDKRLIGATRGLSFQLAYTFSKNMIQTHYLNGWPFQDPKPLNEPAGYDRTNIFTVTGEYDLPVGRGSAFLLPQASGALGALVNDWRVNWVFSDSTGFPQGIPNYTWYTSKHSFVPDGGPTFQQWIYNCGGQPGNCWQGIPSFGQGNLLDQVEYLRQPYIANLDFSLQKNIAAGEGKRVQLRAEAFNFFNTPLFPGPDNNPFDGPPQAQTVGGYTGFGTVALIQQNFPRRIQLSLKYLF